MGIFDIEGPMAVAQQTSNGSFPELVENNPYKKALQSSQETVKPPAPLSDSDLQGCFFRNLPKIWVFLRTRKRPDCGLLCRWTSKMALTFPKWTLRHGEMRQPSFLFGISSLTSCLVAVEGNHNMKVVFLVNFANPIWNLHSCITYTSVGPQPAKFGVCQTGQPTRKPTATWPGRSQDSKSSTWINSKEFSESLGHVWPRSFSRALPRRERYKVSTLEMYLGVFSHVYKMKAASQRAQLDFKRKRTGLTGRTWSTESKHLRNWASN